MSYATLWLTLNGLRLHAKAAGPEDGRPVILLHGFPEFWWGWERYLDPLARAGFRVIAPDQRGYNRSDKPRGLHAYRLETLASDVTGIMDTFGWERAAVVGHDWGGIVAWAAAALYPERVERLAAVNAPYLNVGFRTLPRRPDQLLRSGYMYFFQLRGLAEAVLRNDNWELLAQGMLRTSRPGAFSPQDLDRYRAAWWRRGAVTSMLNWYRALFFHPPRLPLNPRFRMPVLVLWGERDFALVPELAEASLALCERGRLVRFAEATHWVQHEEPEQVLDHLLGFLTQPEAL